MNRDTPRLSPLARFGVAAAWGFSRLVRRRKFTVVAAVALGAGVLFGWFVSRNQDPVVSLLELLDHGVLGTAVPLVALGLVAGGFGEEVADRTLVYHLVRPVSRTTLFVARYAAGAATGALVGAAMAVAAHVASGTSMGVRVTASSALVAAAGVATVGALYYALAALFRRGIVAALVYTFVVELLFQNMPGTVQRLALTHHVRSLLHRLVDDDFAARSDAVVRAIADRGTPRFDPQAMRPIVEEPWTTLPSDALVCAAVVVVSLVVGARIVTRRDWALKE